MKVKRIDLDILTDNEALIENDMNLDDGRFSIDDIAPPPTKDHAFDIEARLELLPDKFKESIPEGLDIEDKIMEYLSDDFIKERSITDIQLTILMESLKVAYTFYREKGTKESLQSILDITYAIDSAKRSLLNVHKERAKVVKDLNSEGTPTKATPSINASGTVNIQNNFSGTPTDILELYGDAIDLKELE